jgi:secreted trypsin-like serine protease
MGGVHRVAPLRRMVLTAAASLAVLAAGSPAAAASGQPAAGEPVAGTDAAYGAAIANGQAGRPASLVGLATPGGVPWCSGTVVAPTAILTAAHCVTNRNPAALEAVVVGRRIPVASVMVHPGYDRAGSIMDLAVVRTTTVMVGGGVRAALLPEQGDLSVAAPGSVVRAAGYGCSAELPGPAGSTTCIGRGTARFVDMTVRNAADCERALTELGLSGYRAEVELCAGGWAPDGSGADTCRGDSGGPLLTARTDGSAGPAGPDVLAGVVSFGASRCGSSPGFATRASAATEWIRSVMGPVSASGYWLLTDGGQILGFGDAAVSGSAVTATPFAGSQPAPLRLRPWT